MAEQPEEGTRLTAAQIHENVLRPAEREIRRFVTKQPFNAAIGHLHWKQIPVHKGEAAPEKAPLTNNPAELAKHIKSMCYFLDADMIGICEMPDWAWYSHDIKGNPITTRHKYAIVIVIDQGFDTMEGSSGDDWISGGQSYRAYFKSSSVACIVADYIRRLGYAAQAHSNADGDVQQVPLMLLAGLGELSRIGEVILNPFIGPRHKTAVITTDLPLDVDKPIDIADFTGKKTSAAEAALEKAGFKVSVETKNSDEVAKGLVISQDPAKGTGKKGDKVTLVSSKGPVLVTVPNVRAMGTKAAQAVMKKAGFQTRVRAVATNYLGVGYVVYTDPRARSMAPKGSTITLYVI